MSRSRWSRTPRCGVRAPSSSWGFTLIEITVWCFLAMLFLLALGALFVTGRGMYESASGSYMIGQEIEAGIRFLRQDLQETALVSVRIYPNGADAQKTPGMSMASARAYDRPDRFLITRYGVPEWGKHVYYVVEPSGDLTGNLIRWERVDTPRSVFPLPATILADDAAKNATGSYRRVVIRNLLRPGVTLQGVGGAGSFTADADYGGFHPSFVRQQEAEEELTAWNPAQISAGDDAGAVKLRNGTTRVVEVRLTGMLTALGRGKPSLYDLRIRVSPRH